MKDRPSAIVTGAGRGIGRVVAQELARLGYRLCLIARTESDLQETASAIEDAMIAPLDVTSAPDIEATVTRAAEAFGGIDAVVHCAGVAPLIPIDQMSATQWHEIIDTNLSAAYYLARSVWPIFKRQRAGVIVNVSSVAARAPFVGFSAYGASKAALNFLGLSLAQEGQPIGVRVHTVAPGAVETGMFRAMMTKDQWPTDKTLDPADVARVIVQCVTGQLKYTSGEVIWLHRTV